VRGVIGGRLDTVPVILGPLIGHQINFDSAPSLELGMFPARDLDVWIIAVGLMIGQLELPVVAFDGRRAMCLVVAHSACHGAGGADDRT